MSPTPGFRRRRSATGAQVAGALVAFLVPFVARAQPASVPVGLLWRAARPCSSQQEVLAEVGRTLADAHGVQVPVAAEVDIDRPDGEMWRARLRVDGRGGHNERRLEAVNCSEIVSAVALIIAVTVDGDVLPREEPVARSAGTLRATPAVPVPHPGVPTPWRSRFMATGAMVSAAGITPHALYPGAELAFGWSSSRDTTRVRILMALGYFPTEQVVIAGGDRGGEFLRISAAPRGCLSLRRGHFDLGPCLGVELAMMRASGQGPAGTFEGTTTNEWSVAATAGALSSWAVSSQWSVFLRAEVLIPFGRNRFVLTPSETVVYETSAIAGRAGMGLEWRFP